MIDLTQIIEHLSSSASPMENEPGPDERLVCKLRNSDIDEDVCAKELLDWLHNYKALLFFPPSVSDKVARVVVRFCRHEDRKTSSLSKEVLISEFSKLHAQISEVTPKNRLTKKDREITSLVSKALWCCYPFDAPILDDHAERALQILCRLAGIKTSCGKSRYETFVEAWFQVFDQVKSALPIGMVGFFPSKVRSLDAILWQLGRPGFEHGLPDEQIPLLRNPEFADLDAQCAERRIN